MFCVGHSSQCNHRKAEAGKPIGTKAEAPNKSRGEAEASWQAPSPKRHLQHPVCRSTLGRCPRISSYSASLLGIESATKWISGGSEKRLLLIISLQREVASLSSLHSKVTKRSHHLYSPDSVLGAVLSALLLDSLESSVWSEEKGTSVLEMVPGKHREVQDLGPGFTVLSKTGIQSGQLGSGVCALGL